MQIEGKQIGRRSRFQFGPLDIMAAEIKKEDLRMFPENIIAE
jgi:hypothetical protein